MNRRLISAVTTLHFAPTATARAHLLREGVSSDAIEVTGNTGIDAVREIAGRLAAMEQRPTVSMGLDETKRIVLVTAHRRENIGVRLAAICDALRPIADAIPDALIVLVAHRNPNARATIEDFIRDGGPHPRIRVFEPLDYATFIDLLRRCSVVITDSGGVQEEAPLFGKPLLVLRDVTERPEVLEAGVARLVGADRDTITRECVRLLTDPEYYGTMSRIASPFGDGHAAERIVRRLLREG